MYNNNKLSRAERKRRREMADAMELQKKFQKPPTKKSSTEYIEVESPPYVPPKISPREKKRLETLSIETEQKKKDIVVQLRKTPIAQIACERAGVGRSTYYKWRRGDFIFARAADRALEAGRFFINDLAKSKLLQLIKDGNLTAIIFWLKHNDPKFAAVTRIIHEYETATVRPSVEEESITTQEISKMLGNKLMPKFTTEEIKDRIEEGLEESERNASSDKRLESFEEDSEAK